MASPSARQLIQAYGISSDTQLANFARGAGVPLVGIDFAEDIDINQDGAYIINLGDSHIGGTHWTGLWIEGNSALYVDSYGVAPEDVLIAKIHAYNADIDLVYNDGYEFQLYDESLCGMWVLMFFHFMAATPSHVPLTERFKKMTQRYADTIS